MGKRGKLNRRPARRPTPKKSWRDKIKGTVLELILTNQERIIDELRQEIADLKAQRPENRLYVSHCHLEDFPNVALDEYDWVLFTRQASEQMQAWYVNHLGAQAEDLGQIVREQAIRIAALETDLAKAKKTNRNRKQSTNRRQDFEGE